MSVNKHIQLLRKTGLENVGAAKAALESAFTSGKFQAGEPAIAVTNNGEVVLGIQGNATSGSTFYNAASVDALVAALENKIGVLSTLGTDVKTSIVAAINSLKASNVAYVSGSTDTIVSGATTVDAAIKAIDTAVTTMKAGEAEYSISATTENLPANVAKRYNLTKTVAGSGTSVGENIDIPKDSSLADVRLGHVDDTLTHADAQGESPDMDITSGTGSEALCFINRLQNDKYKLTCVDCEAFLSESEFAEGLQVNEHVVSVKLDSTPASDSAKFMYINAAGAIALSGITDSIDTAETNAKAYTDTEIGKLNTTETDAKTHVSVSVTQTDGKVTAVAVTEADIASASGLTAEANARKSVTGQNGENYAANTSANYISGATSMNDADVKLDTQVKANADAISALQNAKVSVSASTATESAKYLKVTTNGEKTVYTVEVSGIDSAITSTISALSATTVGTSGQFIQSISESNGVISATAVSLNDAAVAATEITSGSTTLAVTGTTVEEQISSIGKTMKTLQDGMYDKVESGDGISVTQKENNKQTVSVNLATSGATPDLLYIDTNQKLAFSDTYDCGTWS